MKTKKPNGNGLSSSGWEMRPGGMLVQKRSSDSNQSSIVVPIITLKVKYGSSYHEVKISSQATFGNFDNFILCYYAIFGSFRSHLLSLWDIDKLCIRECVVVMQFFFTFICLKRVVIRKNWFLKWSFSKLLLESRKKKDDC